MLTPQNVKIFSKMSSMLKKAFLLLLMTGVTNLAFTQTSTTDDSKLIEQFIQSKGYSEIIVFDASNIKQFWTDTTIVSRDGLIQVSLNKKNNSTLESVPLKIQLANVIEPQDCKIDIITDNSGVSFDISNANGKRISESSKEDKFVNYYILSNSFHLEDAEDFSFNIRLLSSNEVVSIKKIVVSFSLNKNSAFAGSPGFEKLIKEFEEKGIDVPQSNVQYIFSKEYNKIFFKIPSQAASHPFIFHCYPADEKDLITRPEKTVFNNLDFIPTKVPKTIIPKPYFSKSDFIIVQKPLPDYPCSFFNVGQYDPQSGKKTWGIKINNDGLELSQ